MGSTAQRQQESRKTTARKIKMAKLNQDEINGANWFRLRGDLIRDLGFKAMTGYAKSVYLGLFAEYTGTNNGALALPYGQAMKELGMARATVSKAFTELEKGGFIQVTRQGNASLKSLYALTCFPVNGDDKLSIKGTAKASDNWKRKPKSED
jgi:hypothetical protein